MRSAGRPEHAILDAHQHFWRIGRNDCAWPTAELAPIHRDYGPEDLRCVALPLGVGGSVVVQSQESDRDTDYLLDLAEAEPFVMAVIGWADLKSDAAVTRIAALAGRPKLRGLRPMLQGQPAGWILDPAVEPAIGAMTAHGLVFDALVRPPHLQALHRFAQAHPALQVVVCHAGKPAIAAGDLDPWRRDMSALAALPNVACKLSGLLTEAGERTSTAALQPFVDHVLEAFGPGRVAWGSDWPVLNLAGSYEGWLEQCAQLLGGLTPHDRREVFGGTAARLYGLVLPETRTGPHSKPMQRKPLQ